MVDNGIPKSVSVLLTEILDAWKNRNARTAAAKAGSLTFWRDGMLEQLHQIADGTADEKTFEQLKKNFEQSDKRVAKLIAKLTQARNELSPSKIAQQIDIILNHNWCGKRRVREEIRKIIQRHKVQTDVKNDAALACQAIQALNSELERLNRMVYDH
jgi:hypothetical protein